MSTRSASAALLLALLPVVTAGCGGSGDTAATPAAATSAKAGTFSVSGKVIDSNAEGVPGVRLTFTRVRGSGAVPAAVATRPDGTWSQAGFATGSAYTAKPSLSKTRYSTVTWSFVPASSASFSTAAVVKTFRKQPRTLTFAGMTWAVRDMRGAPGDPPNNWSDYPENVDVDSRGQLHLRVSRRGDGRWFSAQISLLQSQGYRDYVFYLASRYDLLDPNLVAGLFTYGGAGREMDIELCTGISPGVYNSQFVVQPAGAGQVRRFKSDLSRNMRTTHHLTWREGRVDFLSYLGHYPDFPANGTLLDSRSESCARWTCTQGIPAAGNELLVLNLWLIKPLSGCAAGTTRELIIKDVDIR